jgi:cytochrome o ubiquinol oxidase subunit IV
MSTAAPEKRREIWTYVVGYALALALTAAAFAAVRWQTFAASATLAIVLGLALVQMIVHFRFFLRVNSSRSSRDNLWLILFSALIIALMVAGTLVILFNLRQRMM